MLKNHIIMKKVYLLTLLVQFMLMLPCRAQFTITQHFNATNGLSNNFVHGIVQDSRGRAWIATESGLNCFDGYHFSIYKSHNSSLKSNFINTLYRDSKHRKIWIGVKGYGIYLLDENTGYISDITPHHVGISNVMAISPASDGGIWIVCHDKIVHYNYQSASFSTFLATKLKESFRNAIDQNGHLIIAGYYGGMKVINVTTKKIVKITDKNNHINKETINRFMLDKKGTIWIATNFGLRTLSCHNFTLKYLDAVSKGSINDIKSYGNKILIITEKGINVLNSNTGKSLLTLDIKGIWNSYKDDYQNLWLGSNADGIYFLGNINNPFKCIFPKPVWCLMPDGNNMWAGGNTALYLLSTDKLLDTYPLSKEYSGIVLSMQKEDNDHLVLAIAGRLVRFDTQTGSFSEIKYRNKAIAAITFYKDKQNCIWIATNSGIYSLRNGKAFYEYKLNKILGNQVTNCIRIDAVGNIWIGTIENGIYIFDRYHRFFRHLTQSKAFFSNAVMHMHNGSNNRLWLATSEGVGLIDNAGKSYECKHYNYKQGLKDPFIRSIREDKKGNVWVSTNNGLSYLNMESHMFSNFGQDDGIPTSNFTGGLFICDNGMAYASSLDGIIAFDSNQLTAKRQTSPLNFTRCTILNASVSQMSEQIIQPSPDGVYNLNYNENNVRITFSVANLAQSKLVDYSYKVDNLVGDWMLTDENIITFRSLSPGKYVVRVRARLHGQSWDSASTTSMTICIAQPFWWTWQARFVYILLVGIVILLSSRRYKHHLQIKNELDLERRKNIVEQDVNRERLQFFTNIAHEIRTPLSLIYGPVAELEQSKQLSQADSYQVDIIHKNCNRLMELINRLLDFRKVETNNRQLTVSKSNFKKCVKEIGENFKAANQNENVRYILDIEETSPYIYFDKEVIKSILNNLLNNASKYTDKGCIGLLLTQVVKDQHQYSCIKVWDTGCGISQEAISHIFEQYYQAKGKHQASGTGIGLALVKRLCELHHIQISVDSQLNEGTTFTLFIDNEETYTNALHQEADVETQTAMHREAFKISERETQTRTLSLPTLLIVEDSLEINNYIAHSLKDLFHVLQANNGQEGLQIAKEVMPDIVVCDIMMPVMDGFTMTQMLKNDIRTSHIPVIILTAKTTPEDQQHCYECGADSFITKPFSINLIKTRINNILEAQKNTAAFILQKANEKTSISESCEEKSKLSVLDQKFLDKINSFINENIGSEKLSLVLIAQQLNVSQSTLYRKLKALTGMPGNEYIRKLRLNHSLHLMLEANKNISEAAYESGFVDLAYFRTCFKEEYGEVPSDYLKKYHE